MFTWWKLYKSVPYESAVERLSDDTICPGPEFCDDDRESRASQSVRPDEQETSHGS
jgi:hypothetical protein